MAYESYSFVSWTAGTPLSYDRLGQMSTNISQVKDATDDNPKGVIKFKTISSTSFGPYSTNATEHEIIALENSGAVNNLITVPANRYYRLVLNFPGLRINAPGGEDSTFQIAIYEGNTSAKATIGAVWNITVPPYIYLNSASGVPSTATATLKTTNSYPTIVGAGTYAVVLESSAAGVLNKRYYASIKRTAGASSNNLPSFTVLTNDAKLQLYAEDIGGSL
jgi:hypothetical protein